MKIEIACFTGNSGLTDYSISLARALSQTFQVKLITANSLLPRFENMGFSIERVFRRSRHYPVDIFRFFSGVLSRRPDWVLVQGPLKFALLDALIVRALSIFGIQLGVVVHDVLPHYPRAWSRSEFGFYYRSFKRVIVHSVAAMEGVRKLGVVGEVLVVPHGIYDIFDLSNLKQSEAKTRVGGLDDLDFVVLFFGHLEPRKGLDVFLKAAESMKDVGNVKFLLAGESSLSKHPPAHAKRLEAARAMPNVVVHDHRIAFEDVENYFAASDVVALPYLEGTTSGVLKLAVAFGKPVVATKVGDFPEQVPAGAGVLIENDEAVVSSLCGALIAIQSDKISFSEAMASAGQDAQWPVIANRIAIYLKPNC